eukprot:scaffold39446_cov58-Attheya_sp.AAC.1
MAVALRGDDSGDVNGHLVGIIFVGIGLHGGSDGKSLTMISSIDSAFSFRYAMPLGSYFLLQLFKFFLLTT